MANFSSIKFNNVDYPLKDASARDNIASLQTSVSGLDTRVTALEQEVPEGVQVVTLDTFYDTAGTVIEGLSDLDYDKPIYLLVRTGQVLSGESGDDTVFSVAVGEDSYYFTSQFIKYGESVENKDTPQEVVHKYFYLTSTSGDSFKFSIDPINNTISGGTRDIPYATQTVVLPDEYDSGTGTSFTGLDTVDWEKPIFVKGRMTMDSGSVVMSQYLVVLGEPDGEYGYSFSLIDEDGNVRLFLQEFDGHDSVFGGEIANKVIANGQETPTAELTKLTVNNTTYSVPKKAMEFASMEALEQEWGDHPEKFTDGATIKLTETSYYNVTGSDRPPEEYTLESAAFPPQTFDINVYGEDGSFKANLTCYSIDDLTYPVYISTDGGFFIVHVDESLITVANPPEDEFGEPDSALNRIRIRNSYYEIRQPSLIVKPVFISDSEYFGTWVSGPSNSEIARSLYYGLQPVVAQYADLSYDGEQLTIAGGELHLEKLTRTITDSDTGTTYNGGYFITFKKPKSSPDVSQDSYYTVQELSPGHGTSRTAYLVLSGSTPKIIFENVV